MSGNMGGPTPREVLGKGNGMPTKLNENESREENRSLLKEGSSLLNKGGSLVNNASSLLKKETPPKVSLELAQDSPPKNSLLESAGSLLQKGNSRLNNASSLLKLNKQENGSRDNHTGENLKATTEKTNSPQQLFTIKRTLTKTENKQKGTSKEVTLLGLGCWKVEPSVEDQVNEEEGRDEKRDDEEEKHNHSEEKQKRDDEQNHDGEEDGGDNDDRKKKVTEQCSMQVVTVDNSDMQVDAYQIEALEKALRNGVPTVLVMHYAAFVRDRNGFVS